LAFNKAVLIGDFSKNFGIISETVGDPCRFRGSNLLKHLKIIKNPRSDLTNNNIPVNSMGEEPNFVKRGIFMKLSARNLIKGKVAKKQLRIKRKILIHTD